MTNLMNDQNQSIRLLPRITCPHCWEVFAPEEILWISEHPDLLDDPRLGSDQQQRFLPTRFTPEGNAIDSRGCVCRALACPQCHLPVPRALLELQPMFVSIMGTPSCGKSYFLASMTWQLRRIMSESFAMSFTDADPTFNKILNHYEELQFFNPQRDAIIKLAKTEEQGDLYDTVNYGDHVVTYPRPFLFALRPLQNHPNQQNADQISRVFTLYDNAGESFLPGKDTASNPLTRHLVRSQVLMFLFDPTQDPRFREACRGKTADPQMNGAVSNRQDIVLHEVADRVRRHAGLAQSAQYSRPLIVIVTKYDAWSSLLDNERLEPPWIASRSNDWCALDLERIDAVSRRVREVLRRYAPELVAGAEAFARNVVYVPVSATGRAPEVEPESGQITGIRPRDISPVWAEVPILLTLCRWCKGMIPFKNRSGGHANGQGNGRPAGERRYPPKPAGQEPRR